MTEKGSFKLSTSRKGSTSPKPTIRNLSANTSSNHTPRIASLKTSHLVSPLPAFSLSKKSSQDFSPHKSPQSMSRQYYAPTPKSKQTSPRREHSEFSPSQKTEITIKDPKIKHLFDKVINEDTKLIYNTDESYGYFHQYKGLDKQDSLSMSPIKFNNLRTSEMSDESPHSKIRILNSIVRHNSTSSYGLPLGLERNKELTMTSNIIPASPKGEAYKFTSRDSKFMEIMSLKQKNSELSNINGTLKQEVNLVDEFETVLNKRTRIEDFNEKRCDMLKANITKQKRYISQMTSALKLANKFHKDMKNILTYLATSEEEKKPEEEEAKQNQKPATNKEAEIVRANEYANRALTKIYQDIGTTEGLKNFLQNFNEAYEDVKSYHEKNGEVVKLFNMGGALTKDKHLTTQRMDPSVQKKIKYNYVLNQFIKKYKDVYPMHDAYREYDLHKDYKFLDCIKELLVLSDKVDRGFKKVKNFDLSTRSTFTYNETVPENFAQNHDNFRFYMNQFNRSQRMFLNGQEILQLESSLSSLLDDLIKFHNDIVTKREETPIELILKLQDNIRRNVESLLTLGITMSSNLSYKDKIVVVAKRNGYEDQIESLRATTIPEKKILFEIYSEEYENLRQFDDTIVQTRKLLHRSSKEAASLSSDFLTKSLRNASDCVDHLQCCYQDMSFVSRLKDIEMNFSREYSKMLDINMEKVKRFMEAEAKLMDEFFEKVEQNMKELNRNFETTFSSENKEYKHQKSFVTTFRKASKEIKEILTKVSDSRKDAEHKGNIRLEDAFLKSLEKLFDDCKKNRTKLEKT